MSFWRRAALSPARLLPSAGPRARRRLRRTLPSRGRPRRHQPCRPQRPWRPNRQRRGPGLGSGRGGRCSARWQSQQLWLRLLSRPVGAARPARRRQPVGAAASSPPTHFTEADPSKLVLPSSDPPASNLVWNQAKSGGGQEALKRLAKGLNVPVEKLQAAYNNHWDAADTSQQPQAADSVAVVFKTKTGAEDGFATVQASLASGGDVHRIDWNPGGDSFAVLLNKSTTPEYTYVWRTGNLLQKFHLYSSSPDTHVTQDTASSAADRCGASFRGSADKPTRTN